MVDNEKEEIIIGKFDVELQKVWIRYRAVVQWFDFRFDGLKLINGWNYVYQSKDMLQLWMCESWILRAENEISFLL